eukprot:scaffold2895_cov126-Cylindrotheca_fusiformis.AAC.1
MCWKSCSISLGRLGREKRQIDPIMGQPTSQRWKPGATSLIRSDAERWKCSTMKRRRGKSQRGASSIGQLQEKAERRREAQELDGMSACARGRGPKREVPCQKQFPRSQATCSIASGC